MPGQRLTLGNDSSVLRPLQFCAHHRHIIRWCMTWVTHSAFKKLQGIRTGIYSSPCFVQHTQNREENKLFRWFFKKRPIAQKLLQDIKHGDLLISETFIWNICFNMLNIWRNTWMRKWSIYDFTNFVSPINENRCQWNMQNRIEPV
jgi:hypothetical protein